MFNHTCGRGRGRPVERRPADGVSAARRQVAGPDLARRALPGGGVDRIVIDLGVGDNWAHGYEMLNVEA